MKKLVLTFFAVCQLLLFANAQWQQVGSQFSGSPSYSVDAMNIYQGHLVAAGRYSPVMQWDGAAWSDIGTGGGSATAIFVDNNDLYIGGQFTGGDHAKIIHHYDGTSWSNVGVDVFAYDSLAWNTNFRYDNIFKYNGNLYAIYSGALVEFKTGASKFARTIGNMQADLGSDYRGYQYAGMMNSKVYFSATNNATNLVNILVWDDLHWDSLDLSGYDSNLYLQSLCTFGNNLYLFGNFVKSALNYKMIKWDGTAFTELLPGSSNIDVASFGKITAVSNNQLYGFVTIKQTFPAPDVPCIGRWTGSTFDTTGSYTTPGSVNALLVNNNIAYVGGFFKTFNGVADTNIVQSAIAAHTGLNDVALNDLRVSLFPNPATAELNILSGSPIDKVEIYNLTGTLQVSSNQNRVDISDLSAGIYFIKVCSPDGFSIRKFMKQ